MRRIWIGIILLGVLLAGGLWISDFMAQNHSPMAQDLHRAGELAEMDQWELAQAYARRAQDRWEEKWPVTASVADHEPMDEIDALFAQLEIFSQSRDATAYRAVCAHLGSLLEAISQSHSITWWNLM